MISETLTIDMLENMDISETRRREIAETQERLKQTEQEIRTVQSNTNNHANLPIRKNLQANQASGPNENQLMKKDVRAMEMEDNQAGKVLRESVVYRD